MSIVSWTPPDPLNGNAKNLAVYIQEIQHNLNHLQETAGITVTQFSTQVIGSIFFKNAVEEMKKAMENPNFLGYYGYSSIADLLGHDWTAYSRDVSDQTDVWSYGILNDLRKYIDNIRGEDALYFLIRDTNSIASPILEKRDILTFELISSFTLDISPFITNNARIVADRTFFYVLHPTLPNGVVRIYKFSRNAGALIAQSDDIVALFGNSPPSEAGGYGLATNGTYVYVGTSGLPANSEYWGVARRIQAFNPDLTFNFSSSVAFESYNQPPGRASFNNRPWACFGRKVISTDLYNALSSYPKIFKLSANLAVEIELQETALPLFPAGNDAVTDYQNIYVIHGAWVYKFNSFLNWSNRVMSTDFGAPPYNIKYITTNGEELFVAKFIAATGQITSIVKLNPSDMSIVSDTAISYTGWNVVDIIHTKESTFGA